MAALAFKALSYGAEQIPDKFFEKIPGGFFTPQEQKEIERERKQRKKDGRTRHRSEDQYSKRSSRRAPSPATQYSAASDDSDYERERERRKRERRRAKSTGRTSSRSPSRGRHRRHSSDLDGQHSDSRETMAQHEPRQPYFPPPPTSEYKPYNPQEYNPGPAPGHQHRSSAAPSYGYAPQVNRLSSFRRATLAAMPEHSTPVNSSPPLLTSWTMSTPSSPSLFPPRLLDTISRASPVPASFTPSYEPPLAALLRRPLTNTPKAAPSPPSAVNVDYGQYDAPRGHSRYTPSPVYNAAAPPSGADGSIPPPPVGSNSPLNPYHYTDFPASGAGYQPSPPPFSRRRSNSQPSGPYSTYAAPPAREEMMQYAPPPVDAYRGHRQRHQNRARSADSHSHRSRSGKDHGRDDSRMAKVRGRFDSMDLREKGLAASVGGALAGGFAGRSLGKSRLTTLAGAAAGAWGARQLATRSRLVMGHAFYYITKFLIYKQKPKRSPLHVPLPFPIASSHAGSGTQQRPWSPR